MRNTRYKVQGVGYKVKTIYSRPLPMVVRVHRVLRNKLKTLNKVSLWALGALPAQ